MSVTLERRIALYSVAAIVGICLLFGAVSFVASLLIIQYHQRENLHNRLVQIVVRLENAQQSLSREMENLAANPIVPTALLDSSGRDVYLQPFFASHHFSVPEAQGPVLCDFEGKPLAGQIHNALGCFPGSSPVLAVLENEQPQVILDLDLDPGLSSLRALLFQPVRYPGTNRVEGYLVAALDLRALLDDPSLSAPQSTLLLHRVDGRLLYARQDGRPVTTTPALPDLTQPLFAQSSFQHLKLHVTLHTLFDPLAGSAYLLTGYGLGTLALIFLALLVSRRLARHLAAPLIALNEAARRIATEGPEVERVQVNRLDEIGQLAASFNHMAVVLHREQRQLEYLAYHDALTGLPNRLLLFDRLRQAITRSDRERHRIAVCYLDLDGFKPVNDCHGHKNGDRLLIELARRLESAVRAPDTVCRLGGDEFVLLLAGLGSRLECTRILERVSRILSQPHALDNAQTVAVSSSIGVALYPDDGHDPDTLLRHADQAMYQAKQNGRGKVQFFGAPADG